MGADLGCIVGPISAFLWCGIGRLQVYTFGGGGLCGFVDGGFLWGVGIRSVVGWGWWGGSGEVVGYKGWGCLLVDCGVGWYVYGWVCDGWGGEAERNGGVSRKVRKGEGGGHGWMGTSDLTVEGVSYLE